MDFGIPNNESSLPQIDPCLMNKPPNDGKIYCPAIRDTMGACWNYTLANHFAANKCPPLDIFNKSEVVTKYCTSNGTWYLNSEGNAWVNLSRCFLPDEGSMVQYVYYVGNSLSLICLSISVFIFFYFKQLSCDRVTLHKNMFICQLINSLLWIIFYALLTDINVMHHNPVYCQLLYIVAMYFGSGTYFWMFSEGLYLAVILILTFHKGKKLLIICIITGWGVPLIITAAYAISRYIIEKPKKCWTPHTKLFLILTIPNNIALITNVIILLIIIKMLISKLRHPSNREEAQWGKTAKAVFILIPVLGTPNIILLISDNRFSVVQDYISAFISSFQGVLVSFILCFMNQEVRSLLRRRTCQHRMLQNNKTSRRSTYTTELNHHNSFLVNNNVNGNPRRSLGVARMSVRSSVISC